jgi:hypothetical protein
MDYCKDYLSLCVECIQCAMPKKNAPNRAILVRVAVTLKHEVITVLFFEHSYDIFSLLWV